MRATLTCERHSGVELLGPGAVTPPLQVLDKRLRLLDELVHHAVIAERPEQACALAVDAFARDWREVTFASAYLVTDGPQPRLCARAGTPGLDEDWPAIEVHGLS